MEPSSLGWRPLLKSWMHTWPETLHDEKFKKTVNDMFERFVDPCLQLIRKGGLKELVTTSDTNLVKSLMNLLECLMVDKFQDPKKFTYYDVKEVN